MSDALVAYTLEDSIAVLRLDDGKANALSHAVLDALMAAIERADKDEAKALVLAGREGRFCAGFDLSVMRAGIDEMIQLTAKGARVGIALYDAPRPVVLAVTGHALAMGAILLMTADERIGADGDFKIGLNEVQIAMPLPEFAQIFAEERLSRRHLQRATAGAEIYTPATAVDAGFLDRVVAPEDVVPEAIARAKALAATLDPRAHTKTKRDMRARALERLRRNLEKVPPP